MIKRRNTDKRKEKENWQKINKRREREIEGERIMNRKTGGGRGRGTHREISKRMGPSSSRVP